MNDTEMRRILEAIRAARVLNHWALMVCADSNTILEVSRIVVSSLGDSDNFSGRTAVLQPMGRVTLLGVEEGHPQAQEGIPFVVHFFGKKGPGFKKWEAQR